MSVLINVEFGLSRDEVAVALAANGIDTRPFFIPLHTLPPFRHESEAREETTYRTLATLQHKV